MRRGIYIKVTEVDHFIINFDIFNLDWNLVGNIKVTFDGELMWQIWDDVKYSWYISDFSSNNSLKRKKNWKILFKRYHQVKLNLNIKNTLWI